MSHFVADSLPPFGEESSSPESEQCPDAGGTSTHLSDIRQVAITTIRATDLTLGLRRIPAGFYLKILADDIQWQTTNKLVHVDLDVLEWNEQIVLPLETSRNVRFSVYASFELGPMLGHGYLLRTFKISVAELLNHSQHSRPIAFQPENGEVISPCTSLLISVEHTLACKTDVDVLRPIITSTRHDTSELTLKTNAGHIVLGRYRRARNSTDLEQSIAYFERSRDLCPVDHPCLSVALFNLAMAKFIRCQVSGTYVELDVPISLFQDALDLRPTGHPDRPATQLNLAIALLSRFTKYGFQMDFDSAEELLNDVLNACHAKSFIYRSALLAIETSALLHARGTDRNDFLSERPISSVVPLSVDELVRRAELCSQSDDPRALDELISLHYDALKYYNTAHHDRFTLLSNLGTLLNTRFKHRGDVKDLDEAIALHREALTLCAVDHPDRGLPLNNLASALFVRFECRGNDKDLDEAIVLHREAQTLHLVGHPDRHFSLNNLANALLTRFKHRGNDEDLDEAIVLHMEAKTLRPVGHTYRDSSLINLATALSVRFDHRGNDEDLHDVITLFREALTLRPVGHPNWHMSLNNLASVLSTRFRHQGNDKDLDEAIGLHMEAQSFRPVGHPDRDSSLNNLAIALSMRFDHRGNDNDLDEAIALFREAQTLQPVGHPRRDSSLNNLAIALSTRFGRRGNDQDLDEVIALQKEAQTLQLVGHPDRDWSLSNLAKTLLTCFMHRGSDKDLDEAIVLLREVQTLRPVGHPEWHSSLSDLASALWTRFEHGGNDEDLDEAIVLHREAQALCPVGHQRRYLLLNNLALALSTRFRHRRSDEDLDEAIALHREAQALQPVGHPDLDLSLNHLALALSTRFGHRGSAVDLDTAIALHRETRALQPVGHPRLGSSLNNLATALSTRFNHRGNNKDLDEAIVLHREARALRPVGHQDWYLSLNNLANALLTRFNHRGNDKDLDETIMLHMEAQTLWPVGHPHRDSSLSTNFASALSIRFKHRGNDKDLDEAIVLHKEAQTLCPVGHPDRHSSLNNLAFALSMRFDHRGDDKDLDEAIALHMEAQTLRPVGHADRPTSLHHLANTLSTRFDHQGNVEDLDNALAYALSALSQLTKYHPDHSLVNGSLASIYLSFHQLSLNGTNNDTDNLNIAIHHLKAAVGSVSSGLLSRLRAGLEWVRTADQYTHSTLLEAYATSIQLLDSYMSVTASVSSRHHAMKEFPAALAVDAASIALQSGDVCRAVELLEQGRTLIWTQMARFRTPIDSLLERGDHAQALVERFREISSLLDKPPVEHQEGSPRVKEEEEATRYSHLVDEWNSTVQEIRKVEGFSRFMLPPLFSDLQDAARDGPIVSLIASKSFCDAIIIAHQHSPIRVQLRTSLERLECLVITLHQAVHDGPQGMQEGETIKTEPEVVPQQKQTRLIEVLRELWVDVVCPVVENLARFAQRGSRIWWCPTLFFNFLPLHAAGEYRRGGRNLSQSYVSSYTPSLTALMRARRSHDRSLPIPFAVIGQDHPPGFKYPLPCVEPELELVGSLLPPAPTVSFTKVTSAESTKSRTLRTLRDNRWLHFACHGKQNFDEPFKSAFLMRDQPLTLLDITQMDLSQHEFVFLSACETAIGVPQAADEVIHLAAGLQFGGVKSVIGTFWSVEDRTVQRLVEEFYKRFCGDGKMDSRRAAGALRKAVQSLANDKDIAMDQRIVFMHIGL